jgi:hypothetical protein
MATAIHLICRHGQHGEWPESVTHDPATKTFSSGFWDIPAEDAEALVGGWLYLHPSKAEPSYFGGPISGFEQVLRDDAKRQKRIAFKFHPNASGRGQRWRGHDHSRAWTSGLVQAGLPHEVKV